MRSGIIFILLVSGFFLSSCDHYNQVLKSNDPELKKEKAKEYYNKGKYYKALPLFEELLSLYRGSDELEDLYYYYCYCYYAQENYIIAAYNFKNYVNSFPNSDRAEECQFMHAYSYYQISPQPELDQTYTYKAIEAFQLFVNAYPNSDRVEEANQLINKLRRKLEMKAFLSSKLYYDMGTWKAAATSFRNLLEDYPDSPEAEQVYLLMLKSYFYLAENSVHSKQVERYRQAIQAYRDFTRKYPDSRNLKQAEAIYEASLKAIKQLTNNN